MQTFSHIPYTNTMNTFAVRTQTFRLLGSRTKLHVGPRLPSTMVMPSDKKLLFL